MTGSGTLSVGERRFTFLDVQLLTLQSASDHSRPVDVLKEPTIAKMTTE